MWLKLVGLEINLFLISGSRSISLEEKILCLDIWLEVRMDTYNMYSFDYQLPLNGN